MWLLVYLTAIVVTGLALTKGLGLIDVMVFMGNLSQSYRASPAIWDYIVLHFDIGEHVFLNLSQTG